MYGKIYVTWETRNRYCNELEFPQLIGEDKGIAKGVQKFSHPSQNGGIQEDIVLKQGGQNFILPTKGGKTEKTKIVCILVNAAIGFGWYRTEVRNGENIHLLCGQE